MANEQLIAVITEAVLQQLACSTAKTGNEVPADADKGQRAKIPLGISNRHVHLAREDVKILFGDDAKLTKYKDLSQPGQFACEEKVTLVGPKGVIEKVRVLGPARSKTQVEVAVSDCIKLGIEAPLRESGDLKGSAGLTLVGPKGSLTLKEGAIIAARHIHMHTRDAIKLGFKDKDYTTVKTVGPRRVVFDDVLVRVSDSFKLEMHIDIDEANAALQKNNNYVML